MGSFGKRVDDYHDRIVTRGRGEFDYEVHTDVFPSFRRDWERMEFTCWLLTECLRPQTQVASTDILPYVPRHLRPPIVAGYHLQCLPPSRVSSEGGVMVKRDYATSELGVSRNIDLSSEQE